MGGQISSNGALALHSETFVESERHKGVSDTQATVCVSSPGVPHNFVWNLQFVIEFFCMWEARFPPQGISRHGAMLFKALFPQCVQFPTIKVRTHGIPAFTQRLIDH